MRKSTIYASWVFATVVFIGLGAYSKTLRLSDGPTYLLFLGLYLATYLLPVAFPRSRPVHITLVAVFTTLLMHGPLVTAILSLIAALPGSRIAGAKNARELWDGLLSGFQFAFTALTAGIFYWMLGLSEDGNPLRPERLGAILAVAGIFVLAHMLAYYLGSSFRRRKDALPFSAFLIFEVGIYGVSVPFAVLMLLIQNNFGIGGSLLFLLPVGMGVQAVRMTVDSYLLRKQLTAMEAISRGSVSGGDFSELLHQFFRVIAAVIHFDRCTLWLADMEQAVLYVARSTVHAYEETGPRLSFGEGLIGRVAVKGKPVILRNRKPESPSVLSSENLPSAILIPLMAEQKVIGVLEFASLLSGAYSLFHYERVKSLAAQLAIAIDNAFLHTRMREMAITDGLTGLLNHRRLQEELMEEIRRADRYRHSLSIIMIDVDNFKRYNDTYGHPKGDLLLRMVANLIRNTVRQVDIVGRYGGEEFLVVLPETNKLQAQFTAERIRVAVAEYRFFGSGQVPAVRKTISLGVASYPDDARTQAELIDGADQALYRAKQKGKNQVLTA